MADFWIVNSSPLIVLGKAGCLPLLETLVHTLTVPHAVAGEILSGPLHDPARHWLETAGASCIAPPVSIPPGIASLNLGAGESAVIASALVLSGSEAILDDLAARRAAAALGLPVRGTLAVILTAKQRGLIPAAAPLFTAVEQAGLFVSPALKVQALALVGE